MKFNGSANVLLPKKLFWNTEETFIGRKIKYAIMKRKNDFKFDEITYPDVSKISPEYEEVMEMMESF